MTAVLLGGRGILGSGFRAHLPDALRLAPRWADPDAVAAELHEALPACIPADEPSLVVWAAGVGAIGAAREAMEAETRAIGALCDALRRLPGDQRQGLTVVFASSAGALFGGHGTGEVGEDTAPAPITAYGHEKLAQEDLLRRLAADAGCRVVACRYSNLYGLADGRLPNRGLVPVAVRATRLRQPMTVYVSPDTRRDLVYNADAAAAALRLARDAPPGFTAALVRDGTTRTVSEILSLIGQVSRRRVPVTYADRPETRLQPRVLRFTRPPRGPDAVRRTPMATAIHRMMRAPMPR
jgi:UDP-glucose 4-epimerase